MYKEKVKTMTNEELISEYKWQAGMLEDCPEFDTRGKYNCCLKEMNKRNLTV